jgi:hypothetical protein
VIRRLAGVAGLRPAIARGHINFTAENRLDAPLTRMVVKENRREQVSVFGDGYGRHLEPGRLVEQLVDSTRAVQKRELGMKMQVYEIQRCYSHSIVDGGLELMSYTTRLMPLTSFTMRDETRASTSCGSRAQSAVIPSRLSTARIAAVYS